MAAAAEILRPPSAELDSAIAEITLGTIGEPTEDIGYYSYAPAPDGLKYNLEHLARLEAGLLKGFGKGVLNLAHLHLVHDDTEKVWPQPIRKYEVYNGHERVLLVTDPNPELGYDPNTVTNFILIPGLSEFDEGTAKELHVAFAEVFPDSKITTLINPGVSAFGKTLPIHEALNKTLEEIAEEDLEIAASIAGDNPAIIVGTSLGTDIGTLLAELNLSKDFYEVLNIQELQFFAPAVGPRNIPDSEHLMDANDHEKIKELSLHFALHMPPDIMRVAIRHPEEAGRNAAALGSLLLSPRKNVARVAAMYGHFTAAQKGIDWYKVLAVREKYKTSIVEGADDPLAQAAMPHWARLHELNSDGLGILVRGGYGHAMTVDAQGSVLAMRDLSKGIFSKPKQQEKVSKVSLLSLR